jgi:hypothetical protein
VPGCAVEKLAHGDGVKESIESMVNVSVSWFSPDTETIYLPVVSIERKAMYGSLWFYNGSLIFLALIAFTVLHWLGIPTGNWVDWLVGMAIFEWLVVIVTVPWNIYFAAKNTAEDGRESIARGITVDESQIAYADVVSVRSLWVAIVLHLVSAVGLYLLSYSGITPLGYLGSGAALLLTLLRPAVSTYEYLAERLSAMRQQFEYPRTDIITLQDRLGNLELQIERMEQKLDLEEPTSFASEQQRRWEIDRSEIAKLGATINALQATNDLEHDRLSREAKQAISQITVDGQFLEHVREIIRFFKSA